MPQYIGLVNYDGYGMDLGQALKMVFKKHYHPERATTRVKNRRNKKGGDK